MTEFSLSSADRSRLSERRRELLREQRRLNLRRFFRNGHAVAGALIILAMVLLAVFAPLLAPADPLAQTVANRFAKPGTEGYLLGADKLGRDLLSRIIYGARVSMIVGVSSSLCSMLFGMIIGLYACYYKAIDNVLMRICDGLSAIPSILLAIALMAVLGQSLVNVIFALSIVYLAAHRAEYSSGGGGAGLLQLCRRDHHRGLAELPRRRGSRAAAQLGQYPRRRSRGHHQGLVDGGLSRTCDRPGRHGHQHLRRRASGHPRPAYQLRKAQWLPIGLFSPPQAGRRASVIPDCRFF